MKKLIIILLVFFYFLILYKSTDLVFANKIDIQLKSNELALTFLSTNGGKSILIKSQNKNYLIIIDNINNKKLKKYLNIFNATNAKRYVLIKNKKYLYHNQSIAYNIQISKNIIKLNQYNLCINSINNQKCDFVYLTNNQNIDNVKATALFYDFSIDKDKIKGIYDNWIDLYEINSNTFTTIKIENNSYNIIIIPSTKT